MATKTLWWKVKNIFAPKAAKTAMGWIPAATGKQSLADKLRFDPTKNSQYLSGYNVGFPQMPKIAWVWSTLSMATTAKQSRLQPQAQPGYAWWSAPAAPATPPPPTSPLQDTVDRLLSKAGYTSGYKPKKDVLANQQQDLKQRYLAMRGPLISIE
jgi:hypothetical protein